MSDLQDICVLCSVPVCVWIKTTIRWHNIKTQPIACYALHVYVYVETSDDTVRISFSLWFQMWQAMLTNRAIAAIIQINCIRKDWNKSPQKRPNFKGVRLKKVTLFCVFFKYFGRGGEVWIICYLIPVSERDSWNHPVAVHVWYVFNGSIQPTRSQIQ